MIDAKDAVKPRPALDNRLLNPNNALEKKVSLPGYNSIPFRGTPPFLKDLDDVTKQPKTAYQVYADIFDLSIPDDRFYYSQVWQLAANGFALISADERQYDEDAKNWRVFLRWALPYTYAPESNPHG
jgi:hypothetical protein